MIQELRIGNWLKRKSQPDGFQIDSSSFFTCELHPTWYEPIPLTEEWLIKMGFERGVYWAAIITHVGQILADKEYNIFFNDICIQHIKFVHQLQNLYFALTNTELEIKF